MYLAIISPAGEKLQAQYTRFGSRNQESPLILLEIFFIVCVNDSTAMIVILHVAAVALGYLVGSFPTAYLLVKWKTSRDIRTLGSGNVGTLNSYEVTNSKLVGAGVLVVDLIKGMVAVVLARTLGDDFSLSAAAALGAVAGHNFPVWLGFHGGRGLATAAGVMLVVAWPVILIWMAAWFVGYKLSRDVNVGNAAATLLLLVLALILPGALMREWIAGASDGGGVRIFLLLLALLILVRLVEPVKEYLTKRTGTRVA